VVYIVGNQALPNRHNREVCQNWRTSLSQTNKILLIVFNIKHVIIIAFVSIVSFTSCGMIVIDGSGYESLSHEEKAKVKVCTAAIDSLKADGNVYEITGRQLKDYLHKFSKSIVYEWVSYCSNESCVPPAYAERICQERGYKFCLVAVTYDRLENAKGTESTIPRLRQWEIYALA